MKRSYVLVAVGAAILAALVWSYDTYFATQADGIDIGNTTLVERGKAIYAKECAVCHGRNLEGQTPNWRTRFSDGSFPAPPHDDTGHTWHHPDQLLFEVTKFGPAQRPAGKTVSVMPAFKDKLADDDIWAVLSYIKSRWPDQIRRRHDMLNRRIQEQR